MTPPARRAVFSLIVFFAVCAVVGTFLQRGVGAQSSQDESQIRDNLKSFTDVYAIVEQNYAEPINGDKADEPSMTGPFPACCACSIPTPTSTIPRPTRRCAKTSAAQYYGVGMVIQPQNNKIVRHLPL